MKDKATSLLKNHHMSITDSRRQILDLFLNKKGGALKHSDIEKSLSGLDRVTIYRTLQIFTEKGLIHSIPGSDGSARYALCNGPCRDGHHHDDHVHFHCQACGATQCLDHLTIPTIQIPSGLRTERIEMIITGYCNTCNQKVFN
jgi:Fur family ferric uptake transcriptional regulator